jgi:hypothetical protein
MNFTRWIFINILIFSAVLIISCGQSVKKQPPANEGSADWQYFGLSSPGETPQMFSPEIISTNKNERDFTISPAGNIMFYSMVLPAKNFNVVLYLNFDGFFWSEPEVARFSGQYDDLEPSYSPDGNKLFFISKRPVGNREKSDYDIWYIEKTENGWSAPKNFGAPVNTEKDEYYPSMAANGNLYFTTKNDSSGSEDIYISRFENGSYIQPESLGDAINTDLFEFNAYIAPDESYLIFSSWGREDDLGSGDLYIAYRNADGSWNAAKNMGGTINSDRLDYCPFVTHDGQYLFYTSQRENKDFKTKTRKKMINIHQMANAIDNGLGNIYWIEFDKDAWR